MAVGLAVLLVALPGPTRPAGAVSGWDPMSLEYAVAEAELVVLGTVSEVLDAYMVGKWTIITPAVVRVSQVLKGTHTAPTLRVLQHGGMLPDRSAVQDPSLPLMEAGEAVALLLQWRPALEGYVPYEQWGILGVREDAVTGRYTAEPIEPLTIFLATVERWKETGPAPRPGEGDLRLELVHRKDAATLEFLAVNTAGSEVLLRFPTAQTHNVLARGGDEVVWHLFDEREFPLEMREIRLPPGERLVFAIPIPDLPDGEYTFVAWLTAGNVGYRRAELVAQLGRAEAEPPQPPGSGEPAARPSMAGRLALGAAATLAAGAVFALRRNRRRA